MSTIRVNEITSDGTDINSITTENLYKGRCKVWCAFNGRGSIALQSAHNVSSLTDIGTANYRVNFNITLTANQYCATGAMGSSRTSWSDGFDNEDEYFMTGQQNNTNCYMYGSDIDDGSGNADAEFVYFVVFANNG